MTCRERGRSCFWLGFRNTPFQNPPVYAIKRIVNILRRLNSSNLFLVKKVPIFAAHFQKRKLLFYRNSRKNKGGREVPRKQAHGALSLRAARRLPHDGTLSIKIGGFAAAPDGVPDMLIRCTCWVADTTVSLLFDFQI